MSRELDLVLFGATGFVGRLTAEHLAAHAPEGTRIGLAGRSLGKLETLRSDLGERAAGWPLIVADSADRPALDAMAARATAIATTVGPYRKYGVALAEACAAAGTHYADLTGETLFMRDIIDRCHDAAVASGARIVHTCGFDSIPSDLGVHVLHQAAGAPLTDTTLVVTAIKGGASGGTIDSMRVMVDEVKGDRSLLKTLNDPYALSPDRAAEPDLGPERDPRGPDHDEELGGWLAPFVMGTVNTRVVRRSNALLGHPYGRRFKYREMMRTGEGHVGRAKAFGVVGGLGALVGSLSLKPLRIVADRLLPDPGEGPSEESRRNGFFKIEIHSRTEDGRKVVAKVAAKGDPGYAATAVMLGEAGLCLALDGEKLPDRAGVLTPATAMGDTLVDRLRAAGQTFEAEVR